MNELHAEEVLKLEFEYARETAYQAQNDRTVIVNLYLILVGGLGSLLLAAISLIPSSRLDLPTQALALLFLVLGLLGALTLFKLIRLRQAWFESVRAMNAIKEFYLESFPELERAIIWKTKTVPHLGKAWSITFILSAMVVLLDSLAFAAAMHFFALRAGDTELALDGIVFFLVLGIQILLYFFELRPPEGSGGDAATKKEDEAQ